MLSHPSKPVGPWGSPEADLRSAHSHSDIWSSSSRSVSGCMPTASPKPAYIAQGPAEHLTSFELDRPTSVLEPALDLVNSLLDHALFTLLNTSRSTALAALKQAVPKLLKQRLGQAAIRVAEEDLQDMADAGEELDAAAEADLPAHPRSFDPELAWKLARLRAMAHVRLGDMEEEDCDDYLEQDGLDEYANHPVLAAGAVSTFFLTSIIEFLGEHALCLAAQFAEKRHAATIARQATASSPTPADRGPVVIAAVDMHALGREGSLSRLWRAWRRDVRMTESWASRATMPALLASPTLTESARSRKSSIIIHPDKAIPEEDSQPRALPPIQLRLPVRVSDVRELQGRGPAFAPVLARERRARSQPRSDRAAVTSHADLSPLSPVSPILPSADPPFQERSRLSPHQYSVRSLSLPPSASTRNPSSPLQPVSHEPVSPETVGPELDSPSLQDKRREERSGPEPVSPETVGPELDSPSPLQDKRREERTGPEPVTPETVGPELDSPSPLQDKRRGERTGPEPVTPETISPEPVTPETISPEPVTPETISPETISPETISPETISPETISPRLVSPEPDSPSPLRAKPREEGSSSGLQDNRTAEATNFALQENRTQVPPTSSVTPPPEKASLHVQQAEPDAGHVEATDEHDSHRASIISGAVGAIAGALGIEAMRSAQLSRQQKDSSSPIERQAYKSVAEEIMGPSIPVAAPANPNTGPSINNVRDFDDMHIPVVAHDDDFGQHRRHERQISHLTTGHDDDGIHQHGSHELQVSHPTTDNHDPDHDVRNQRPVSPFNADNDRARHHLRDERSVSDLTTNNDDLDQHLRHERQVSDPEDLALSSTDDEHPSAHRPPLQARNPTLDGATDQDQNPAPVNLHTAQPQQCLPASPTSATSLNREAATIDDHILTLTGHQGIDMDTPNAPNRPPHTLNQFSAKSARESSTSQYSHSDRNSPSLYSSKQPVPGEGQDPMAPAALTQQATCTDKSDVDNDAWQPKVEEKKKSLEILINSDETLHYTLTPEPARPQDGNSRSPVKIKTQTQELADFFRTTAPPGDWPVHFATAKPSSPSPRPAQSRTPDQLLTPVEQRASQRAAAQAGFKPRSPLGVPRDARPERNTTRDLADYARSTGPTTDAQLPQALGAIPRAHRYTSSAGALRPNGLAATPLGPRSANSLPSSNTAKSTNRLHYQARDPRPARGAGTTELIEFIREGPPRTPTDHGPDRHLAPFRSPMDTEDINYVRASVGSARNSSVLTARSVQGSTNSRTGLLDSQKSTNRANGVNSASPGIAQQTIPELDRMPAKKRMAPRDPYAIDDSDDEALEEELARAPPKQESLIDFLRNTAPPPGMSTQPVLAAVPGADNKPDAKPSASPSKLRELVGRSNSITYTQSSRLGRSTKPSNGARESSPHLTQVGSKLDKYRPTQTTHAAHVERNRQRARTEPRTTSTLQTGTSDLADYLRNTGPVEPAGPSEGYARYRSSVTKDQPGLSKFFKWRGSVKR
ncbi:hypothetical protein DV736_g3622, partial [Chaetothyriales sp. CBS 134916]